MQNQNEYNAKNFSHEIQSKVLFLKCQKFHWCKTIQHLKIYIVKTWVHNASLLFQVIAPAQWSGINFEVDSIAYYFWACHLYAMDVDDIFRLLGAPGRYQVIIYIMLCCNYYPVVINHLAMAIYGARTAFMCALPTNSSSNNYSTSDSMKLTLDKCYINYTDMLTNVTTKEECTSWDYELDDREVNIVSEVSLLTFSLLDLSIGCLIFIGVYIHN